MRGSSLKQPVLRWSGALLVAACVAAWAGSAALAQQQQQRAPAHTYVDHVLPLVEKARQSPFVRPTRSADERLVIGRSPGWPENPTVPQHDLFGFEITDRSAEGEKQRIIIASGNHNTEWTGSWGMHGAVEFLLSDAPEAAALRRVAIFYVYPLVNPDGRYTLRGRGSPQTQSLRASDHNRIWNTVGRFPTVDIQVAAMKRDTGGTADYLLDFHSAGSTFFYTTEALRDTPIARAWVARDSITRPNISAGHPGMLRIWSKTDAGLRIPIAYTPEFASSLSAERAQLLGRNYMLGFYDVLVAGGGGAEELDLSQLEPLKAAACCAG